MKKKESNKYQWIFFSKWIVCGALALAASIVATGIYQYRSSHLERLASKVISLAEKMENVEMGTYSSFSIEIKKLQSNDVEYSKVVNTPEFLEGLRKILIQRHRNGESIPYYLVIFLSEREFSLGGDVEVPILAGKIGCNLFPLNDWMNYNIESCGAARRILLQNPMKTTEAMKPFCDNTTRVYCSGSAESTLAFLGDLRVCDVAKSIIQEASGEDVKVPTKSESPSESFLKEIDEFVKSPN